jgi:hypothetical protein
MKQVESNNDWVNVSFVTRVTVIQCGKKWLVTVSATEFSIEFCHETEAAALACAKAWCDAVDAA